MVRGFESCHVCRRCLVTRVAVGPSLHEGGERQEDIHESEGEGWARKLSQACAHVCVCLGAGLRAGGGRLLPYEGCRRSQPRRERAAAEPQRLSIRGSRAMRYAGLGCGRSLRDRRSGEARAYASGRHLAAVTHAAEALLQG